MKRSLSTIWLFLWLAVEASGQGTFWFYERTAPTRVGSIDGPIAGPGFWGQALVGLTADSLSPLGIPVEHRTNGRVVGDVLSVPFADAGRTVLVQMAAWDGTVWGTSFASVPANQLGFTDTVPVYLTTILGDPDFPQFTSPAVVPLVPEPSAAALALLGGAAILVHLRRRCRTS